MGVKPRIVMGDACVGQKKGGKKNKNIVEGQARQ